MKDMTCLVTGAEGGLGYAFALEMAREGYEVVLLSRDASRGADARLQLIRESGNPDIDLLLADFSQLNDVRRLVSQIKSQYSQVDILAHLGGITYPVAVLTNEGIEANLAYNLLAPFLLTAGLLDLMGGVVPGRILILSAENHRTGEADPEDIMKRRRFKPHIAYSQSSLTRLIWSMELARRVAHMGISVNSFSAGHSRLVFLDRVAQTLPMSAGLGKWRSRRFFHRIVQPLAELALVDSHSGISGHYFVDGVITQPVPIASDQELGIRMWSAMERITGIYPFVDMLLEATLATPD